jgi:hypothetical protein
VRGSWDWGGRWLGERRGTEPGTATRYRAVPTEAGAPKHPVSLCSPSSTTRPTIRRAGRRRHRQVLMGTWKSRCPYLRRACTGRRRGKGCTGKQHTIPPRRCQGHLQALSSVSVQARKDRLESRWERAPSIAVTAAPDATATVYGRRCVNQKSIIAESAPASLPVDDAPSIETGTAAVALVQVPQPTPLG